MEDREIGFVHLHVHTEYSFLDGLCKVEKLMEETKRHGMRAVAITDHGTMHGVVKFYQEALKQGVHPVLGCEVYVAPRSRFDRGNKEEETEGTLVDYAGGGQKGHYHHLVLLAQNNEGYRNLIELCSRAYLEGFYYKPRVDKELLTQYSKGLIALSACLAGEIPSHILGGHEHLAKAAIKTHQKIFGEEHYYLEIQHNGIPEQETVNAALARLARETGAPLVATNDCHYLRRQDAELQQVMLCLQTQSTLQDKKMSFETDEFFLKSPVEMHTALGHYHGAIENTHRIAEHCSVDLKLKVKHMHMPTFPLPEGFSGTQRDYMRELVYQGAWRRYGQGPGPKLEQLAQAEKLQLERPIVKAIAAGLPQELVQRIDYELGVIERMDYVDYFLIVWDFIHYAREQGIFVGPGRGSAAGSIVAYSLGITDIDPLKFDLLFERFLNPDRVSPPDIDTDFSDKRRGEVIDYCGRKYGRENVGQIATFSRLKARAAIKDVGRVLGLPPIECNQITKLMDNLKMDVTLEEALREEPKLAEVRARDALHRKLFDYAGQVEGHVRQTGVHAAGIIIAPDNLKTWTPLMKTKDEQVCTQFEQKELESLGLMKMDFLGLKTLSVIEDCLRHIRETEGLEIDVDRLPEDDAKTFEMLSRGRTDGVFQLESSGMKNLLKNLRPSNFLDMVPLVALYRPGPLQSGMVDDFVNRKHGRAPVRYAHPSLKPILEETYGVVLYQEQVIRIAHEYAGFTLAEADEMRRAMGKKNTEIMREMEAKFVAGAGLKHSIPTKDAKALFELIEKFAGYGFNKSHSAAYGVVAYQTAYLKANYPKEYLAAMLTNDMGNTDKVVKYVKECRDWGIAVLPPDVNSSGVGFTATKDGVRFGLAAIKGMGTAGVEVLLHERHTHGSFTSLQEFCQRIDTSVINPKRIEMLIRCGAMDTLGVRRSQLLALLPSVVEQTTTAQRDKKLGQASLFEVLDEDPSVAVFKPPDLPELDQRQRLVDEKALVGFYITGHPLNDVAGRLKILSTATSQQLADQLEQSTKESLRIPVRLAGIISSLTRKRLKNKNNEHNGQSEEMASFLLEDLDGVVEAVAFSSVYSVFSHLLAEERIVVLEGTAERGQSLEVNIRVQTVSDLDTAFEKYVAALNIDLSGLERDENCLKDLRQTLEQNPGRSKVRFTVKNNGARVRFEADRKFNVAATPQLVRGLAQVLDAQRIGYDLAGVQLADSGNGGYRRG